MPDRSKIVSIDPITPDTDYILKAGKILSNNGVVIFPAKCLYGVAVNALNVGAVKKVFDLKKRPLDNPLLVLIKDQIMLNRLVTKISSTAQRLMDTFWPGNLTLVFKAHECVPKQLTAGTGKIGIRIPSHPVAKALVNSLDFPITGTSANLSGKEGCTSIDQLPSSIVEQTDLLLDAGCVKGGTGSTIADVTGKTIHVLREGEVSQGQIQIALA